MTGASNTNDTQRYPCPICQNTFTRPQHVVRHLRSHTGERPYKCKECGDAFARSDLLSRHVNKCHPHIAAQQVANNPGGGRAGKRRSCEQCAHNGAKCDYEGPCSPCKDAGIPCSRAPKNTPHATTKNAATTSSAAILNHAYATFPSVMAPPGSASSALHNHPHLHQHAAARDASSEYSDGWSSSASSTRSRGYSDAGSVSSHMSQDSLSGVGFRLDGVNLGGHPNGSRDSLISSGSHGHHSGHPFDTSSINTNGHLNGGGGGGGGGPGGPGGLGQPTMTQSQVREMYGGTLPSGYPQYAISNPAAVALGLGYSPPPPPSGAPLQPPSSSLPANWQLLQNPNQNPLLAASQGYHHHHQGQPTQQHPFQTTTTTGGPDDPNAHHLYGGGGDSSTSSGSANGSVPPLSMSVSSANSSPLPPHSLGGGGHGGSDTSNANSPNSNAYQRSNSVGIPSGAYADTKLLAGALASGGFGNAQDRQLPLPMLSQQQQQQQQQQSPTQYSLTSNLTVPNGLTDSRNPGAGPFSDPHGNALFLPHGAGSGIQPYGAPHHQQQQQAGGMSDRPRSRRDSVASSIHSSSDAHSHSHSHAQSSLYGPTSSGMNSPMPTTSLQNAQQSGQPFPTDAFNGLALHPHHPHQGGGGGNGAAGNEGDSLDSNAQQSTHQQQQQQASQQAPSSSSSESQAESQKKMRALWASWLATPFSSASEKDAFVLNNGVITPLNHPAGGAGGAGAEGVGRSASAQGQHGLNQMSKTMSMPSIKTPLLSPTKRPFGFNNQNGSGGGGGGAAGSSSSNALDAPTPRGPLPPGGGGGGGGGGNNGYFTAEDLKSYQEACLTRETPSLKLGPTSRLSNLRNASGSPNSGGSSGGADTASSVGGGGSQSVSPPMMNVTAPDTPLAKPNNSHSNYYTSSTSSSSNAYARPSYKRLASQTLGPKDSKSQRTLFDFGSADEAGFGDDEDPHDHDFDDGFGRGDASAMRFTGGGGGGGIGGGFGAMAGVGGAGSNRPSGLMTRKRSNSTPPASKLFTVTV